jgi:DNA adenine methylase
VADVSARHGFTSPLRYPGGKGAIADFIKLALKKNSLTDGHYVELFAGGAGIAWPLLFEEYVQHVHVNDISHAVYAFWRSVLNDTEALCRLVWDVPVTIEEWRRQKQVQSDLHNHTTLDLAFSTFFLNRTNRSGILRGGVIGGQEQDGKWKLDARYNKKDLIARIKRIARYRNRISVYHLDAADFIRMQMHNLPDKALLYLDPPYYVKGQDLYQNHYSPADHANLASLLCDQVNHPWIISYDAAPEIVDLYKRYVNIRYDLSYSAQDRYFGSEIMFFSHNLTAPEVPHPARVDKRLLNVEERCNVIRRKLEG